MIVFKINRRRIWLEGNRVVATTSVIIKSSTVRSVPIGHEKTFLATDNKETMGSLPGKSAAFNRYDLKGFQHAANSIFVNLENPTEEH